MKAGGPSGLTDRTTIDEGGGAGGDIDLDPRGELQEQVVRMLAVDQRFAVCGLARGEQVGIAALAHQRVEAEHGAQFDPGGVAQRAAGGDHAIVCTKATSSPRGPPWLITAPQA